jgi:CSLREA domain-containing protein
MVRTTSRYLALSLSLAMVLAVSALVFATLARPAFATNIGVTTTADEDNTDGDCSLREAVIAANTNAARPCRATWTFLAPP